MGLKHSKLSPRQQGELLKLFIAGATARTAAELVGIHRNSAALYFRKLRELIAAHQEREMRQAFNGEVEIDEPYFGGRRKGKRGRGAAGKVAVFGLIKKGREGVHADDRRLPTRHAHADHPSTDQARQRRLLRYIRQLQHALGRGLPPRASTTTTCWPSRAGVTSTGSRTSGTRPSVICAGSTACRKKASTCSGKNTSGGSIRKVQKTS